MTASNPGGGPASNSSRRAERLIMAGGVVFLIGLLAIGLALVLSAKSGSTPTALLVVGVLCPVGFALAFAGLVTQSRR